MKKNAGRTETLFDLITVWMALLVLAGGALSSAELEKYLLFDVTADRLLFNGLTVVLLIRRFVRKRAAYPLTRPFLVFAGMMGFWILYGAAGAVLSPYSGIWMGGRECFFLLRGLGILYCLYEILDTRRRTELFLTALRVVCGGLILLALWESFSGWQMDISRCDPMPVVSLDGRRYLSGLYFPRLFIATAKDYNENNFCAAMVTLSPLFYPGDGLRPHQKLLRLLFFAALAFLVQVDGSTISSVALLAGLLCYVLLARRNRFGKSLMMGTLVLLFTRGADWLGTLLLRIKGRLSGGLSGEELLSRAGLAMPRIEFSLIPTTAKSAAAVQSVPNGIVSTVSRDTQPMMERLWLTQDALEAALVSKGLGVGPGGFMVFNQEYPGRHSTYINPHNWWLEILSQYGVFVFAAYLASILWLYVGMIRAYTKNHDELFALVVSMCTAMVFASVAPSSFVGEMYQWLMPGLCLVLLHQEEARAKALA